MTTRAIIPRFLLPLQGPLWRGISIPLSQNSIRIRFASSSTEKPIVLEKPARFNPPSHGSRAKRNHVPKHYGPDLTAAEIAAQNTKNYPGMMAPEGTWAHFFWHSRILHTFITMVRHPLRPRRLHLLHELRLQLALQGTRAPISDLWTHPIHFFVGWKNVILLHEQDKAEKAVEHRTRHLDDVAKRRYFMKMHGIETKDPVSIVFGKGEEKSEDELEAAAMGREPPQKTEEEKKPEEAKKKWLGIF
ncbi:hypothetical protein MRS44_007321 [Fusarium solani]|uniref:uncharacterized protein n=1 Tax=Fusarium solani TaxID=169388 RepID=UPI0032C49EC7|nr:hypothetical protein MRS44_007321 [Fusarium solani]